MDTRTKLMENLVQIEANNDTVGYRAADANTYLVEAKAAIDAALEKFGGEHSDLSKASQLIVQALEQVATITSASEVVELQRIQANGRLEDSDEATMENILFTEDLHLKIIRYPLRSVVVPVAINRAQTPTAELINRKDLEVSYAGTPAVETGEVLQDLGQEAG